MSNINKYVSFIAEQAKKTFRTDVNKENYHTDSIQHDDSKSAIRKKVAQQNPHLSPEHADEAAHKLHGHLQTLDY